MTDAGNPRPDAPATAYRPDWYPDPSGRYEFRYHNGAAWTADVSSGGTRYVDTAGAAGAAAPARLRSRHPGSAPGRAGSPTTPGGPAASGPAASGPAASGPAASGPAAFGPAAFGPPAFGPGAAKGKSGNGVAIAGLTCGIMSVAFGWLPVVFVVGAVLAVLGVVFGIVGLRRSRRTGTGRGFALGGLVTGLIGVAVSVGGLLFTVALFRALDRFENPEPHTVEITTCDVDDGTATVAGTIRNDGTTAAGFTVRVVIGRTGSGVRVSSTRSELADVAPGAVVEWRATRAVTVDEIECSTPDVSGPLPFGVDPG